MSNSYTPALELRELRRQLAERDAEIDVLESEVAFAEKYAQERDAEIDRLRTLFARVEHCDGGICPTCGMESHEEHRPETACPLGQHVAEALRDAGLRSDE